MRVVQGISIALAIFLTSFALHIVGGATGQGWLFAVAVVLIFVSATGFPIIALAVGRFPDLQGADARLTCAIGAAAGYGFTVAALWAANGRDFAWWQLPLAAILCFAVSTTLFVILRTRLTSRRHSTRVVGSPVLRKRA